VTPTECHWLNHANASLWEKHKNNARLRFFLANMAHLAIIIYEAVNEINRFNWKDGRLISRKEEDITLR
jgi:hypothetical protein